MIDTTSLPVPPAPFALTVALNKALFAYAAVKSQAAVLAQEEKLLAAAQADLEAAMQEAGVTSLGSHLGAVVRAPKIVYNVADWIPVWERIRRTNEFDLLYRRVNQTAMRDRASNGDLPDGVREVTVQEMKFTLL